jgi:hypothetical protein
VRAVKDLRTLRPDLKNPPEKLTQKSETKTKSEKKHEQTYLQQQTSKTGSDARAAQHRGTIAAIHKLKHKRTENTLPEQTEQAAARGFDSSC